MELFNIDNPYFERWKPGRPTKRALEKRAKYWRWEQYYSENKQSAPNKKKKAKLHPAITHINASPGFFENEDSVRMLNEMVDKAYHTIKKPKK